MTVVLWGGAGVVVVPLVTIIIITMIITIVMSKTK